ncbi:hypothetical protein CTAYLR_010125 [Chrysophaeum taylorii]|uniref:Uncharacterized protein n=1 Tax=Chrysophaeum taylorii TaxID=2483200 RepID=A0AAD7UJ69_9STRA|nr:hypothetical protein CTAYLR_010125 [Chrysophaeum taylorii]
MPPKKKDKAVDADDGDPGMHPATLLSNYTKFCKLICVAPNPKLVEMLSNDDKVEELKKNKQLILDDEKGQLGPAGTRALCTAIMGSGQGMVNAQCRVVKILRFWRVNVNNDGAACIAELLRLGGAEIAITFLELLDNNVGAAGARCLGQALMYGQNRSLVTLKLDYNYTLGSEGVAALCQGLRTNSSLRQLHLPYCNIGPEGGAPLGEMLSYRLTALVLLNLQGNQLCGRGMSDICDGLASNAVLTSLSLADNGVGQCDEDLDAVKKLGLVVVQPGNALTAIDLLYNRIGEKGGRALLDIWKGKTPNKVKQLLVDSTLPQQLFDHLCRIDAAGGKKKKGNKGAKKKKKKKT